MNVSWFLGVELSVLGYQVLGGWVLRLGTSSEYFI